MLKKGRRDGQDGRKFHENEKKERTFSVRSSTSRTLIRRSGFTLTLSNPPAFSCRVALSFPSSRVSLTSLPYPCIPPSCPRLHLSRCSSIRFDVFEELFARRGHFQITLGTTGSVAAMPFPEERNRYRDIA